MSSQAGMTLLRWASRSLRTQPWEDMNMMNLFEFILPIANANSPSRDLSYNKGLKDSLPDLGNFKKLISLSLVGCSFSGPVPESNGSLPLLSFLWLPCINTFIAQQFLFQRQWKKVRDYAKKKGIKIMGDMPIYVGYHSADVWANRSQFLLVGILFDAISREVGQLDIIAEDLGVIIEDVVEVRKSIGAPGMSVLQFGFGGDADTPHFPHNHESNQVAYSGTHDNNTDILGLGSSARMNTPATQAGNWSWRIPTSVSFFFLENEAAKLQNLLSLYGRL